MADLTRLLLRAGVNWRSVAACEHQQRPCRSGARPCSGVTGPPCPVTSSREHQGGKGKARQEPDEREELYAVLATEDREDSGFSVSSERGKSRQCTFTFTQLTQVRGGGGRGVQGGAVGGVW
jgi:hypothetical protein